MSSNDTATTVEMRFWRDQLLSNAAFWDRVEGHPGTLYPIPGAEPSGSAPREGTWTVALDGNRNVIAATSSGDRDDWHTVRVVGSVFVTSYDSETIELDGHEVSAVSTYLDVRPLLADIDEPTSVQVGADEFTTATYTNPEVMATLTRALALVEGGERLDIAYRADAGLVHWVHRFADGRLCESVTVNLNGAGSQDAASPSTSPT
ncbi:hypothetical protein GCM10009706_22750 [Curtobacterium citreum]|uniref:Uncharacterized protein n=1 Tax=Curtobacterium citreum TaxID=2036 RepID=A0ABT2HJ92_9MICO|nr:MULTISPECIES: hypothetical protein [Curtobacterium]MCS6523344.1 hypothetical protein [Curtobacterium citreum]GGL83503.1 hypothetical protein GCM10009706_22750 [Curtobacterium citreum]